MRSRIDAVPNMARSCARRTARKADRSAGTPSNGTTRLPSLIVRFKSSPFIISPPHHHEQGHTPKEPDYGACQTGHKPAEPAPKYHISPSYPMLEPDRRWLNILLIKPVTHSVKPRVLHYRFTIATATTSAARTPANTVRSANSTNLVTSIHMILLHLLP